MSLPVMAVFEITLHDFVFRLDISQFFLLQLQLNFKNEKLRYANRTKGFFKFYFSAGLKGNSGNLVYFFDI